MRKNGFTLIELLAVIVILAIIALIATPIILGIINEAKEESNKRSVELYASAIKNAVAAYQLREGKEIAARTYESNELNFVEYDGNVVCDRIDIYEDGAIYVTKCEVNGDPVEYEYGTRQVEKGKMSSVCNPISVQTKGTYTAGDKYECDVDPNKEGYDYIFYVLTTVEVPEDAEEGTISVNLIMDSNINISGNAVKVEESDLGLVAWSADEYDSSCGPITAINHLQTATKDWTNTNTQTLSTFNACDGNGFCVEKQLTNTYTLNARMPYHSELNNYNSKTGAYAYLYDNLKVLCFDADWNPMSSCDAAEYKVGVGVYAEGLGYVIGIDGYWTMSAYPFEGYAAAHTIDFQGTVWNSLSPGYSVTDDTYYGVRPVINLSI